MSLAHQIIQAGEGKGDGLALDLIQIDGGTQSRANLNDQVVADYAAAIAEGASFPAIVVFYDGKKHWLADGFHRFHAFQKAGRKTIPADVRQGTRRDAILHSVGANASHGLRRTNDDKRRAVLTLLNDAEWGKWTDREIARRCAVSPQTVANARADTVQNGQSDERRYVHPKTGKPTTMKTAGINASRNHSQAKASEDNGSITGGAGAVTGEASKLASGRTDAGEAASVDLPTNSETERDIIAEVIALWALATPTQRDEIRAIINPETPANPSAPQARQATAAGEVNPPASPATHSSNDAIGEVKARSRLPNAAGVEPSLPEADAGGPVSASAAHSDPAERRSDAVFGERFSHPTSDASISSQPAGSVGVPHSIPHKSGEVKVQPAKPLRPHCLRPELCASGTRDHCHACKKAMAESEAAA